MPDRHELCTGQETGTFFPRKQGWAVESLQPANICARKSRNKFLTNTGFPNVERYEVAGNGPLLQSAEQPSMDHLGISRHDDIDHQQNNQTGND